MRMNIVCYCAFGQMGFFGPNLVPLKLLDPLSHPTGWGSLLDSPSLFVQFTSSRIDTSGVL